MTDDFFDSSALAKHYHVEAGTPTVDQLLADPAVRPIISRLTVVEIQSVFATKVRMGAISAADFQPLRHRFLADIGQRRLLVARVTSAHFQDAARLLAKHATSQRLRTLDALQLAVALDLRGRGMLDHFVCSDNGLIPVAAAEGLAIIQP